MANMKYGQGVLHSSGGEVLERSGIKNSGYIDKKRTPFGEGANFNHLPPGHDIDNQHTSDQRKMTMRMPMATGYANDGWEGEVGAEQAQVGLGPEPRIDLPLAGKDTVVDS